MYGVKKGGLSPMPAIAWCKWDSYQLIGPVVVPIALFEAFRQGLVDSDRHLSDRGIQGRPASGSVLIKQGLQHYGVFYAI